MPRPDDDTIARRTEEFASGTYQPEIPGLDGLMFAALTLRDRGVASRAYSARLMELHKQGGMYSRALLGEVLRQRCAEAGIDPACTQRWLKVLRRLFDQAPDLGAPPRLTAAEVARLAPEEREQHLVALAEYNDRLAAHIEGALTDDERLLRDQVRQVEALERELERHTYEHHARAHQYNVELQLGGRRADAPEKPYFADVAAVEALAEKSPEVLRQLYTAWREWREGRHPDFSSRAS